MIPKKRLLELVDNYDRLYQKNFDCYQQSGESRYLTNAERYQDMAEAFQMAADAEEDYSKKAHYASMLTNFAARADVAIRDNAPGEMKTILQDLVDSAVKNKLYWKRDSD